MATEEEHFLREIATYLETHEPLPVLWSLPELSDLDLLDTPPLVNADVPLPPSAANDTECRAKDDPNARTSSLTGNSSSSSSSNDDDDDDTNRKKRQAQRQAQRPYAATGKAKAKRSRNLSRERMQSELKLLRTQSVELQERLARLRQHHQQGSEVQVSLSQKDVMLVATWERIAKRQVEERSRAEMENLRLKEQLNRQIAVARHLQQSMGQLERTPSYVPGVLPLQQHARVVTKPSVFFDAEDVALFGKLYSELDAAFDKMDGVFEESGLNNWRAMSTTSQAQMKTRRSTFSAEEDALYIELIDTDVIPFPMELVFNASWHCWDRQSAARSCTEYQWAGQPKDVVALKTRIEIYLNEKCVSLEFLFISKGYREEGRISYVWRCITKADAHFPGVYIDETGWQAMKPIDDSGDTASTNGTVILTCSQLESKKLGGSLDAQEHARVSPLTNLVMSAYEEDILEVNNMMMSMLLQDTPPPPSPLLAVDTTHCVDQSPI